MNTALPTRKFWPLIFSLNGLPTFWTPWMTGAPGWLPAWTTRCVSDPERPAESETPRITLYTPSLWYVWEGFCSAEGEVPSPKSHE